MKILVLDIETAPNKAFVWDNSIWKGGIGSDMMQESSRVLCWSAKWLGESEVMFGSEWEDGEEFMLIKIHSLLDEADVVVHYNGIRFDIPRLNTEFLKYRMNPPSPYKQLDMYQCVKRNFSFVYNKLSWVVKELDLGEKIKHRGFQLWVECMEGKAEAQREMKKYNIRDVEILERLYVVLRPWIKNHPNYGIYNRALVCPNCGGNHYQSRGTMVTKSLSYQRYQCTDCGSWFRDAQSDKQISTKKFTGV